MQIVDALGEDGLLRYWGFSYGTALGATVAAMFPDRMDKVILDGVLNVQEYYAGRDVQEATDTDATFRGFFEGCIANAHDCVLAKDAATPEKLYRKTYKLLERLKYDPIVIANGTSLALVGYDNVKAEIENALYNTNSWPGLASALHGLLTGNSTAVIESQADTGDEPIFPNNGPEALYGIRCSDSSLRTNNLTELSPLIHEFQAKSTIFGDVFPLQALACAQWPFQAKERYTGSFRVDTKHPLLFIGNTYDPVTPLISAQNVSAGFKGSAVLEHNGYGVSLKYIYVLAVVLSGD